MISITTIEVSTVSGVVFDELPDSKFRDNPVRVKRIQTLDGGAVVDHRGFSDADRTFFIQAEIDEDTADDLYWIYKNKTIVNLSCKEGFFKGVIQKCAIDNGLLNMIFLVSE